jgi:predicted RNA binding protein YcfA (HicA-like mRNA interferase family)
VWKFSTVTGKALVAALKNAGFLAQRVKGSYHFLRHPDGRTTVVQVHSGESLGSGLLAKILRDVDLSRSELEELLA